MTDRWVCLCGLNHNVNDGRCLACGTAQWSMRTGFGGDPYKSVQSCGYVQRTKQRFMKDPKPESK